MRRRSWCKFIPIEGRRRRCVAGRYGRSRRRQIISCRTAAAVAAWCGGVARARVFVGSVRRTIKWGRPCSTAKDGRGACVRRSIGRSIGRRRRVGASSQPQAPARRRRWRWWSQHGHYSLLSRRRCLLLLLLMTSMSLSFPLPRFPTGVRRGTSLLLVLLLLKPSKRKEKKKRFDNQYLAQSDTFRSPHESPPNIKQNKIITIQTHHKNCALEKNLYFPTLPGAMKRRQRQRWHSTWRPASLYMAFQLGSVSAI